MISRKKTPHTASDTQPDQSCRMIDQERELKSQMVRKALAIRKSITIRFKNRTYTVPNILCNQYVVGD
jgi:hypothetical protein